MGREEREVGSPQSAYLGGNYDIWSDGSVINRTTGHTLKPWLKNGKPVVNIRDGRLIRVYLHRAVAQHFMPDFDPNKWVRFKDGDPLNCNLDNLTQLEAP